MVRLSANSSPTQLATTSPSVSTVLGATGALARVGGDEFAALLTQINAANARLLFEAAASAVRLPIEGTDVAVTVTRGAAGLDVSRGLAGTVGKGR